MIKRVISYFTLAIVPTLTLWHAHVYAASSDVIKGGIDDASGGAPPGGAKTINETIATIVNLLSAAVGVAAIIMIIVAGFRYVTSAGNPESAKSAKNTILYAIIGLIVVALAQILVHFVLFNVK